MQEAVTVLGVLEKLFTILAIIVGGLWAYYNYFRGRVYRPRLEPSVTARLFEDNRYYHLQISSTLKNVGLSKVDIDRDVSGLRVLSYEPGSDITELESADWQHLGTFPVFENHRWIEAGESIVDERLVSVAKTECEAFRIVVRVVGKKISWKAEEIVHKAKANSDL